MLRKKNIRFFTLISQIKLQFECSFIKAKSVSSSSILSRFCTLLGLCSDIFEGQYVCYQYQVDCFHLPVNAYNSVPSKPTCSTHIIQCSLLRQFFMDYSFTCLPIFPIFLITSPSHLPHSSSLNSNSNHL